MPRFPFDLNIDHVVLCMELRQHPNSVGGHCAEPVQFDESAGASFCKHCVKWSPVSVDITECVRAVGYDRAEPRDYLDNRILVINAEVAELLAEVDKLLERVHHLNGRQTLYAKLIPPIPRIAATIHTRIEQGKEPHQGSGGSSTRRDCEPHTHRL